MPAANGGRPDPDALLEKVQQEEARARRGKLRIYFGASAGVGKTYAMLLGARGLREEGREVVAGVVETHGRAETAALLAGLEVLPPREVEYRGRRLRELDLDGALARRPSLLLVDELAHTNVPGSRHPKRWQDVEELVESGIDVFTTLNVQHLESLNDVVGSITGINVWETVPDTFFDSADEVILVDLTPDELLARLKVGKVYIPEQAHRAAQNFFRKGNLIALREIALRRTADRVEEDVQTYRADQAIERVWKTGASLLCCVGPTPGGEHIVRSAARLATQLNVDWTAVYVETPALQTLPSEKRERILKTVKLAQDLGASTAVLAGSDAAASIVQYARRRNLSKIVIGRPEARRLAWWQRPLGQRVAELAPDIDLIEIGRSEPGPATEARAEAGAPEAEWTYRPPRRWPGYLWAVAACLLTGAIAAPLLDYLDLANIVMLFLLTVVLIGLKFGRGPAALAAVVNVVAFDLLFVPPSLVLDVHDAQYLLTFVIMLAVGLITGQLTAGLRYQASVASHREERARELYELARDLSMLLRTEDVVASADEFVRRAFRAEVAVLVPDETGRLIYNPDDSHPLAINPGTAQWAFDKSQAAGTGTDTLPGSPFLYLPLRAPMRTRGVLAIQPQSRRLLMIPEQRRHLETYAALIAIALERVHYVEIAQQALIRIESERLRNSLLSAISHDLRTPLAALYGLADSLRLIQPGLSAQQTDIAEAIRDQARRLGALVDNLLDMARIQSGDVRLNLQWHPIEEVVGSALKSSELVLAKHHVEVSLDRELPLVELDAVLVERVLCNLLENAAKYTPPGSTVRLKAVTSEDSLLVTVSDNGPGLPRGQEEALFEKFTRGSRESATPGVGLGLAICRAIVEAHRGRILAEQNPDGGARFTFALPLGKPPEMRAGGEGEIPAQ